MVITSLFFTSVMTRPNRNYGVAEKAAVLSLRNVGYITLQCFKLHQIADTLKLSYNFVQRTCKGNQGLTPAKTAGRQRSTTAQQDRILYRAARKTPVWGCITSSGTEQFSTAYYLGVGKLIRLNGKINGEEYVNQVLKVVFPDSRVTSKRKPKFVFQQVHFLFCFFF